MELGKTKLGGERKEIFKIKDGDNIYRPLPPMGKLAKQGVMSRYFRVVWGYKDSEGNLRPFISPRVQNFKTRMIEVDCAAFNRVMALKDEFTESTKQAKELAKNKQPIPLELKKRLEELNDLVGKKGRFNIDSKHHFNAIAQDGTIGLLKLAGYGFKAMKALFKQLEGSGVDPSAVENGRFLNFNRQGTGLDTQYTVSEIKQTIQTEEYGEVQKDIPHTLNEAVIGRLSAEAYELDDIYPAPSEEDVARIVAASMISDEEMGKVVDEIFGARDAEQKPAETPVEEAPLAKAEAKVEARAEAVAETPQTSVSETIETPAGDTVNTGTGEVLAETKTEIKTVETPAKEANIPAELNVAGTGTVPSNPAVESDDDFLAGLGVKLA